MVLDLTEQYRGKAYRIFCDNLFSSPRLFRTLHGHSLYACGTVRQNRKDFPSDRRGVTLQVGEAQFCQSDFLTAVVWQDKRPVHVISTLSQPGATESVSRRQRDGSRSLVTCPSAIATYTQHMGGVDLDDQLRKYYSVRLKCTKNYKYVFWFTFDVCITNVFWFTFDVCITKMSCAIPSIPTSVDHSRLKSFRVRLAKALIGDYNSRQRGRRNTTAAVTRPLVVPDGFHTPRHHPRRRCAYCRTYRNPPCRRESVWQCIQCEGAPTLCLTGREDGSDCWSLWHQME